MTTKSKVVSIIEPGTPVIIAAANETIQARVSQVCIAAQAHITYQCIWWAGSERKDAWLEEWEVMLGNGQLTLRVGFNLNKDAKV